VDLNAAVWLFVDRLVMCDCFVVRVECANDDVVVKLFNAE